LKRKRGDFFPFLAISEKRSEKKGINTDPCGEGKKEQCLSRKRIKGGRENTCSATKNSSFPQTDIEKEKRKIRQTGTGRGKEKEEENREDIEHGKGGVFADFRGLRKKRKSVCHTLHSSEAGKKGGEVYLILTLTTRSIKKRKGEGTRRVPRQSASN